MRLPWQGVGAQRTNKLRIEEWRRILELADEGASITEIARLPRRSRGTVQRALDRRAAAHNRRLNRQREELLAQLLLRAVQATDPAEQCACLSLFEALSGVGKGSA